jgi:hypothetical protein
MCVLNDFEKVRAKAKALSAAGSKTAFAARPRLFFSYEPKKR